MWPSGFHWFLPDDRLGGALLAIGWIGVLLLLVVTGFETDLVLISKFRRAASFVILGSLLLPVRHRVARGMEDAGRPSSVTTRTGSCFALFMAAALSISSLPVIAKVLSELEMLRRNFGQIAWPRGWRTTSSAGSCSV